MFAAACIVVGSELRVAGRAGQGELQGRGSEFISGGLSRPVPRGGEKLGMQGSSNQTRDGGGNREMMQSHVEILRRQGFIDLPQSSTRV